jgi:hypothetical protein
VTLKVAFWCCILPAVLSNPIHSQPLVWHITDFGWVCHYELQKDTLVLWPRAMQTGQGSSVSIVTRLWVYIVGTPHKPISSPF